MGRRSVLLLVAVLIAAVGSALVFLYVRGVDERAQAAEEQVAVLVATGTIRAGESAQEALSAGKLDTAEVPRRTVAQGAVSSTQDLGTGVALSTIFPGEQILSAKFGQLGSQDVLAVPRGKMAIAVELTDPQRVSTFVTPGSKIAIIHTWTSSVDVGGEKKDIVFSRLLLPKVQVLGAGETTILSKTTTTAEGEATTEEVPQTILTIAVNRLDGEKVTWADMHGELSFGLLTDDSNIKRSKNAVSIATAFGGDPVGTGLGTATTPQ